MRSSLPSAVMLLGCALAACSFTVDAQPDADIITPPSSICGNGQIEDGEDCDDGNQELDSTCDATCHFTCGNGVFDAEVGEVCEKTLASGTGACPTACGDGDSCTADILSGSECTAACVHSAITVAADGDGCCPAGANGNTDDDCSAMCGNGIVEPGELCDPAILAGAGACPTACNDQMSCTTDALVSANTCQARCVATPITSNTAGDGCCAAGATPAQDADCAGCGNGVVEPALMETCDTGIASGAGACPTTCEDGNACTTNALANAGTCRAACIFPPVTAPANGDGCCPTGANATNDTDCAPVCGNGVKEGTEACDDGNVANGDACSSTCTLGVVPTAFKFTTLSLREPHAFASVPFFGCTDLTNSLFGNAINEQFKSNIEKDEDGDGFLDLAPTLVFRPRNQTSGATTPLDLNFAKCTAPKETTTCAPGDEPAIALTAANQGTGTCLDVLAGTVRSPAYNPSVTVTGASCFGSQATMVTFDLAGVPVTLTDARVAATYAGNPATGVVNGLLRGFVSEAVANATIIPANIAVVGGQSLGSLLRGGMGNCRNGSRKVAAQDAGSDMDSNGGVIGWWFYLNFTATQRPWTE